MALTIERFGSLRRPRSDVRKTLFPMTGPLILQDPPARGRLLIEDRSLGCARPTRGCTISGRSPAEKTSRHFAFLRDGGRFLAFGRGGR